MSARLLCGDVLDVLATLPDRSVRCCVTSPPYWGLRDYGTGSWEGGDADCDHVYNHGVQGSGGQRSDRTFTAQAVYRDSCGKCGARRIDNQLGLEPTPEEYVTKMVEVFREVRRVLTDDGTLWLNLGDSYAANRSYQVSDTKHKSHDFGDSNSTQLPPGLKPKDLVGIPWRVAFALQADGWWLRSDIIWNKPNPMPESVTDRPTKSHEYLFLMSKSQRYYYDGDAIAERSVSDHNSGNGYARPEQLSRGGRGQVEGWTVQETRNARTVWTIATKPYPQAHFATFPPELPERCIKAGTSQRGQCPECGAAWERVVEAVSPDGRRGEVKGGKAYDTEGRPLMGDNMFDHGVRGSWNSGGQTLQRETKGWRPTCKHDTEPVPDTVLDLCGGSGTTSAVATGLGREAIYIDLNPDYLPMAEHRIGPLLVAP